MYVHNASRLTAVFRAIHKPDWLWPTRLAPLLHKIMFCLGLSYVKWGAIFGHNKHVLSVNTKYQVPLFQIINLSRLLPLTFQFTASLWSCTMYYISLLLTVLDIIYSSSNTAKNWQTSCFCTVCPGWKCGWERIWLDTMQAASIVSKIKHTDVYHQNINHNCLFLLYYT